MDGRLRIGGMRETCEGPMHRLELSVWSWRRTAPVRRTRRDARPARVASMHLTKSEVVHA
jgi:hypothetical protein